MNATAIMALWAERDARYAHARHPTLPVARAAVVENRLREAEMIDNATERNVALHLATTWTVPLSVYTRRR